MTTRKGFVFFCLLLSLLGLHLACGPTTSGPGTEGSSNLEGGLSREGTSAAERTEKEQPKSELSSFETAQLPERIADGAEPVVESPERPDRPERTREVEVEGKEPLRPTSVDTKLDKTTAMAGEVVAVTCVVRDQNGDVLKVDTAIKVTPQAKGTINASDLSLAEAGKYKVACQLKDKSLEDTTPEELTIVAAAPAKIDTKITPGQIRAGGSSTVTCSVTDAYNNPIVGAKTSFVVNPKEKITISGRKVSGTKVGSFDVACQLSASLRDATPETLVIVPGLPAKIELKPDPRKTYYKPEDTILLERKVYDAYGNLVSSAKVKVTSSPSTNVDTSGYPDSVSFKKDGTYKVTVAVDGPTEGGSPVAATVTLKVDGFGPTLSVSSPVRAAMLTGSSTVAIQGKVTDSVSGVASLKINGKAVAVGAGGAFKSSMLAKWGLNLIELEAKDKAGNVSVRAQSFLWSSSYKPMGTSRIGRAAIARLNQKAIDDGDRRTLNDLASILEKVINSLDIDSYVPQTLVSGRFKIPPFGPTVSYSVTKNGKVTMGYRSIKLRARTGGLYVEALVKNVRVPLKGSAARFLNKSVTIVGSEVKVVGNINISYSNGRAVVTVPSLSADVSKVSVNAFSGIFGFLNGLVTRALRSRIKSALEDAIKKALPGPIQNFLTGFKFARLFTLPAQLGSKKINLDSGLDYIRFDSSGGTLGLGVGVSSSRGISSGKRGTPLRRQTLPSWSSTAYAFGVGIAYNVLNHALTTAWYSGAFKQDLSSLVAGNTSSLPLSPKNLKLNLEALLPPILHSGTQGHDLDLGVGDMLLRLTFDMQGVGQVSARAYLTARFGAKVNLSSKNELSIQLSTTPLQFAVDVISLSGLGSVNPSEFSKLLKGLAPQLSQYLSSSVLQKFPIPSIDLSALGGKYGIPSGVNLTIKRGKLSIPGDYLKVTGDL